MGWTGIFRQVHRLESRTSVCYSGQVRVWIQGTVAIDLSSITPETDREIRSALTLQKRAYDGSSTPVAFFLDYRDGWLHVPREWFLNQPRYVSFITRDDWNDNRSDGFPLPPGTCAHVTFGQSPFPPDQPSFIESIVSRAQGWGRGGLCVAPTRSGKTLCSLEAACRLGRSTLILVNNGELLKQWVRDIEEELRVPCGIIREDRWDRNTPFTVAMAQTLINRDMSLEDRRTYGTVIVDECLPGDETVITDVGPVRMDDPDLANRSVLAYSRTEKKFRYRRVLRHIKRSVREVFRVVTSSGRVLRCTSDERLLSGGKWRYLSELRPGDSLTMLNGASALADAESRSQPHGATTSKGDQTVGCENATRKGTTGGVNLRQIQKNQSHRVRVAAGKYRHGRDIGTCAGMSGLVPNGLPPSYLGEFTALSSETRASDMRTRTQAVHHISTSRTDWSSRSGLTTRCPSSQPFRGIDWRWSIKGLVKEVSTVDQAAALSLSAYTMSCGRTVVEHRSALLARGSKRLMHQAAPGGTWTTDHSTKVRACFTHKGSRKSSVNSSLSGSLVSAIAPARPALGEDTISSGCGNGPVNGGGESFGNSLSHPCSTNSITSMHVGRRSFTQSDLCALTARGSARLKSADGRIRDVNDARDATTESIVSIAVDAYEQVYDLEVEEDHNYVTTQGFVVHNCDSAPCKTFWSALHRLHARFVLGLSATPDRQDGLGDAIKWIVGEPIATLTRDLDAEVCWLPFRWTGGNITRRGRTSWVDAEKAMMEDQSRVNKIAELACQWRQAGRQVLVMAGIREHLTNLEQAMRGLGGAPGMFVGGKSTAEARDAGICLTTYALAAKGVDFVKAPNLFIPAGPRRDIRQAVGRALQPQVTERTRILDPYDYHPKLMAWAKRRNEFYAENGFQMLNDIESMAA